MPRSKSITRVKKYLKQPTSGGKHLTIRSLSEDDVVMGRGNAINRFPGNNHFRKVVDEYRVIYREASRKAKQGIAKKLVQDIYQKGGSFVRLLDENPTVVAPGLPCVLIPEERAVEKTCQALRENQIAKKRLKCESFVEVPLSSSSDGNILCSTTGRAPKNRKKTTTTKKILPKKTSSSLKCPRYRRILPKRSCQRNKKEPGTEPIIIEERGKHTKRIPRGKTLSVRCEGKQYSLPLLLSTPNNKGQGDVTSTSQDKSPSGLSPLQSDNVPISDDESSDTGGNEGVDDDEGSSWSQCSENMRTFRRNGSLYSRGTGKCLTYINEESSDSMECTLDASMIPESNITTKRKHEAATVGSRTPPRSRVKTEGDHELLVCSPPAAFYHPAGRNTKTPQRTRNETEHQQSLDYCAVVTPAGPLASSTAGPRNSRESIIQARQLDLDDNTSHMSIDVSCLLCTGEELSGSCACCRPNDFIPLLSPCWVGRDVVVHITESTPLMTVGGTSSPSRVMLPRRVSDVGGHYMETGVPTALNTPAVSMGSDPWDQYLSGGHDLIL